MVEWNRNVSRICDVGRMDLGVFLVGLFFGLSLVIIMC